MKAVGTFEVQIEPEHQSEYEGTSMGRMTLSKVFQGDLEGAAEGTMLTGMGNPPSSAVYVAVERVIGSLNGKTGSFLLAHRGIRSDGGQELAITIVPDSGTGELVGLAGTFVLEVRDGEHHYEMEYELLEAP